VLALLGFGFIDVASIAVGFGTAAVPLVGIGAGVVFAVRILTLVFAFHWSRQRPDRRAGVQPPRREPFDRTALSALRDDLSGSRFPPELSAADYFVGGSHTTRAPRRCDISVLSL
jgi:hypothetical protein